MMTTKQLKYQELLISENATVIDALERLNKVEGLSRMIQFVYNDSKQIIGSLTDGDIRRSLIKDKQVNKLVKTICNTNFEYNFIDEPYLNLDVYRKKDIKIIPLLNRKKQLVDILDCEKTIAKLPIECVIMAGGRGERLNPLTQNTPKPMLPLGDKPIIEHNIDRLIQYGIKKIYISVKYLGQQLVDYFGDGSKKGITIEYIWEEKPLGTAGALSLIDHFETQQILLMNSDLFTNFDFEELFINQTEHQSLMTVATIPYTTKVPYGIFEMQEERITGIKEKPTYVHYANAGIYLLDKQVISSIPKNTFYNITDLIQQLLEKSEVVYQVPIVGYWIDIGQHEDYERAKNIIKHMK